MYDYIYILCKLTCLLFLHFFLIIKYLHVIYYLSVISVENLQLDIIDKRFGQGS